MAENNENNDAEPTETDIFQQQKKTIDTLIQVLEKQGGPQQPVYVSPPAPAAKPPNYLLYAGLAIGAIILFKGKLK